MSENEKRVIIVCEFATISRDHPITALTDYHTRYLLFQNPYLIWLLIKLKMYLSGFDAAASLWTVTVCRLVVLVVCLQAHRHMHIIARGHIVALCLQRALDLRHLVKIVTLWLEFHFGKGCNLKEKSWWEGKMVSEGWWWMVHTTVESSHWDKFMLHTQMNEC